MDLELKYDDAGDIGSKVTRKLSRTRADGWAIATTSIKLQGGPSNYEVIISNRMSN